jgi:hypothetical protein
MPQFEAGQLEVLVEPEDRLDTLPPHQGKGEAIGKTKVLVGNRNSSLAKSFFNFTFEERSACPAKSACPLL